MNGNQLIKHFIAFEHVSYFLLIVYVVFHDLVQGEMRL